MTNATPKRFRPRFSIRTLAIVLTLVCCYAACWGPTKTRGVRDVYSHTSVNGVASGYRAASAAAPLVVGINDSPQRMSVVSSSGIPAYGVAMSVTTKRHYYFWFFGYVAKLPYEREIEVEAVPIIRTYTSFGTEQWTDA